MSTTHHLWVQYAYDDTKDAPVIQTADSEEEAREEHETVMSGCCWYRYDIDAGNALVNPDGPHYFNPEP